MQETDGVDLRPFSTWQARPYQKAACRALQDGCKRSVWIWHRRAGKDEVAMQWAHRAAVLRPGTYWHMLPQSEQARKVIWLAINPHTGRRRIDEVFPREQRTSTNETEMRIGLRCLNGGESIWQLVGSDNYNSLMGASVAGIVFSEWAVGGS